MLLMDSCPGSRLSYDKYAYVQVVAGGILTYIASNRKNDENLKWDSRIFETRKLAIAQTDINLASYRSDEV